MLAGKEAVEVRRMVTRFHTWLVKFVSKYRTLTGELMETQIHALDQLSRVG